MAAGAPALSAFPLNSRTDYAATSKNLQNLAGVDPRIPHELIVGGNSGPGLNEGAPHSTQLDYQPASEFKVPFVQGKFVSKVVGSNPKNLGKYARNRLDTDRIQDGEGIGVDWFELVHIFPKTLELGNVVSNLVFAIDLYSSFRRDSITLTDIDNQIAAQGVSITGAPTLPKQHQPQRSLGVSLNVDQVGPPNIDGDVIFDYDIRDIALPVTGTRVILFPYMPQREFIETLQWKTDIIKSADGTEQRIALRRYPRQGIAYDYVMRDDEDLSTIRTLLTEWQPRVFGVPLWWWARKLTADAALGSTSVTVSTIDNADFRVGSLIMIVQPDPNDLTKLLSDVLEIDSFGSPDNIINFTSATTQAFSTVSGALAVPVLPCLLPGQVTLNRAGDFHEFTLQFLSTDNIVDLADASTFSTYQGKPVIDDPNFMAGRAYRETLTHKNTRLDFGVGRIDAFSTQLLGVNTFPKRWINNDNLSEWQVRGLLYALRGRQQNFFLTTFQNDMELTAAISSLQSNIDIKNIGYTNFIRNRDPFRDIEIVKTDGTTIRRRITGSVAVDSDTERLTLDSAVGVDVAIADLDRISYLQLQRFATDTLRIEHKWIDTDGDKKESHVVGVTVGTPNG